MSNDADAFACGYAYAGYLQGNGKSRDDLPPGHHEELLQRFGVSGTWQWWGGFDRAWWWMQSTEASHIP